MLGDWEQEESEDKYENVCNSSQVSKQVKECVDLSCVLDALRA
jgi:hypothetical protein